MSVDEAIAKRQAAREIGQTVILTNGHFDLLHLGHVDYLQRARALGDVLVVGLNSDASTRALKGAGRPIVPQEERARIVAALACVDYVTTFDAPTANALVEALRPDVYDKGGDWGRDREPPEAAVVRAYGGEVHFIPYLAGHSTSDLIETIIAPYGSRV